MHALEDTVHIESCAVVCVIPHDRVVAPPLPRDHRDRPGQFAVSRVEAQDPAVANVDDVLIIVTVVGPADDSPGPVGIDPEFDSQVGLAVQNRRGQADAVVCPVERQACTGSDARNRRRGKIDLYCGHQVIGIPILVLIQRPTGQVAQSGCFAAAGGQLVKPLPERRIELEVDLRRTVHAGRRYGDFGVVAASDRPVRPEAQQRIGRRITCPVADYRLRECKSNRLDVGGIGMVGRAEVGNVRTFGGHVFVYDAPEATVVPARAAGHRNVGRWQGHTVGEFDSNASPAAPAAVGHVRGAAAIGADRPGPAQHARGDPDRTARPAP